MLARLRRDFAFHSLLWWVPLALAGGLWVWGMSRNVGLELDAIPFENNNRLGLGLFIFLWWTWLSIYLANAGMDHRTASVMDLALPIAPRRLWLEHVTLVVTGGLSILVIVCLTIATGNLLGGLRPLIQPGLLMIAVHLGVGLVLATAVLQLTQPGLRQARMSVPHGTIVGVTMFGYLGLVYLLGHLHPAWSIVPLLVASGLLALSWQRVPIAGFTIVPTRLEEERESTSRAETAPVPNIDLTVWRACYGIFGWLYVLPMMFNMGAFLADPSYEERFTFRFFFWIVAFASVVYPLSRLYMVDSLPIGRRRIFAIIMLPPLLMLALGFGTGITVRETLLSPNPRVEVSKGACCTHIEIPFSYWRIAREGDPTLPPTIFEHEGDSHVVRPYKGSRTIVYNPYQVPHDSDPELIEQTRQRAEAEITSSELGWAIPAEALFLVVPWMLIASISYRATWSGFTPRVTHMLNLTLLAPLVAVGCGLLLLQTVGLVDVSAWSRIAAIEGRLFVEGLPGGVVTAWLLVLIACIGGYFLAESQFRHIEATVKKS